MIIKLGVDNLSFVQWTLNELSWCHENYNDNLCLKVKKDQTGLAVAWHALEHFCMDYTLVTARVIYLYTTISMLEIKRHQWPMDTYTHTHTHTLCIDKESGLRLKCQFVFKKKNVKKAEGKMKGNEPFFSFKVECSKNSSSKK